MRRKWRSRATFGRVARLFRFKDEADIVQANDSEFGPTSRFYPNDLARVVRVAEALVFGMVGVNTGLISTA
jgi:succinate-semialdehyde dehydrogenase / glutarate-semialdehyde dehydrogenase